MLADGWASQASRGLVLPLVSLWWYGFGVRWPWRAALLHNRNCHFSGGRYGSCGDMGVRGSGKISRHSSVAPGLFNSLPIFSGFARSSNTQWAKCVHLLAVDKQQLLAFHGALLTPTDSTLLQGSECTFTVHTTSSVLVAVQRQTHNSKASRCPEQDQLLEDVRTRDSDVRQTTYDSRVTRERQTLL